ncbi:hypothetical protein EMCRGX_G013392 [Ephydatia muelleri]
MQKELRVVRQGQEETTQWLSQQTHRDNFIFKKKGNECQCPGGGSSGCGFKLPQSHGGQPMQGERAAIEKAKKAAERNVAKRRRRLQEGQEEEVAGGEAEGRRMGAVEYPDPGFQRVLVLGVVTQAISRGNPQRWNGYILPFYTEPTPYVRPNQNSSQIEVHVEFVTNAAAELLKGGYIEEVKELPVARYLGFEWGGSFYTFVVLPKVRKEPVAADMMKAMVEAAGPEPPLSEVRLLAIYLVAFAGFLHCNELIKFECSDITFQC